MHRIPLGRRLPTGHTRWTVIIASGVLACATLAISVGVNHASDPPSDDFTVTSSKDLDGDAIVDVVDAVPSGNQPETSAGLVLVTANTGHTVTLVGGCRGA